MKNAPGGIEGDFFHVQSVWWTSVCLAIQIMYKAANFINPIGTNHRVLEQVRSGAKHFLLQPAAEVVSTILLYS